VRDFFLLEEEVHEVSCPHSSSPSPIICGHFDEEAFSSLFDFASFYFFIVLSCVESDGGNSIVGIIYVPECYFFSLLTLF